jgi:O-antigen/teichoic acid export membrane protein
MIAEVLEKLIGSEHSLRRKAITGSNWLMVKSVVIAALDLARAAVFARLLSPDDYGVMALVMTGIGMCDAFSATGIEIMVQRDREHHQEKLSGYWTVKFSRGIILTVLTWFLAIPVAQFYGRPEIIPVMRFLGLSFLFRGLSGFGVEIRQRDMQFRKVALMEIGSGLLVLIAGIVILFITKNIWALATYAVINSFAIMITSYILLPWRPRITISPAIFKEVMLFSGSIVLMNIFNYCFTSIDIVTIGKLLGTEDVGYYARSNFLALLPSTYFAGAVSPVLLPVFRNLAEDNARFRKAFIKVLLAFMAFFSALGILLYVCSKFVILTVYGPKWLPILPIFNILIIYGISKSIVMVTPAVFFIKGKQWSMTLCGALTAVALPFICLPLTIKIGLTGTAWAVVMVAGISHIGLVLYALRLLSSEATPRSSQAIPEEDATLLTEITREDRTTID